MTEIWKNLSRYPGYEISTAGELRHASGKPVPRKMLKYGYTQVYLDTRWEIREQMLHTLLMETFVGPRPSGLVVCHINDIPDDNRLENLVYGTTKLNGEHRSINRKAGKASNRLQIGVEYRKDYTKSGRPVAHRIYYWKEAPASPGYVHRPLRVPAPGRPPGWYI